MNTNMAYFHVHMWWQLSCLFPIWFAVCVGLWFIQQPITCLKHSPLIFLLLLHPLHLPPHPVVSYLHSWTPSGLSGVTCHSTITPLKVLTYTFPQGRCTPKTAFLPYPMEPYITSQFPLANFHYPTLPNLTQPYPILPNLTQSYPTLPNLTQSYPTLPDGPYPMEPLPNLYWVRCGLILSFNNVD